jgi:hypothetical protein
MVEKEWKRLFGIILIAVVIIALLSAFALYTSDKAVQIAESLETVKEQSDGGMPALIPFANWNFDVLITPSVVTVPTSGGSVTVLVELVATNLSASETLLLETHTNILAYSASFNTTSVNLSPGGSASVALTVDIPNGVQSGSYALSVTARGETVQGGGWLVINVGSSQIPPPP